MLEQLAQHEEQVAPVLRWYKASLGRTVPGVGLARACRQLTGQQGQLHRLVAWGWPGLTCRHARPARHMNAHTSSFFMCYLQERMKLVDL